MDGGVALAILWTLLVVLGIPVAAFLVAEFIAWCREDNR